jgi:hypothetical protein
MNELDNLIQQKKELERKIKALKNQSDTVGQVKIDVERYPTDKPDRFFLAVFYKPIPYRGYEPRNKWQTIFSANDRRSVINAIPAIVENLKELYNRNKEEERDADDS